MSHAKAMVATGDKLLERSHEVVFPRNAYEYAADRIAAETHRESTFNKIDQDLIRGHFKEIRHADAILVVNEDKNGIPNYIGGSTFLEMGFAHVLRKKIFLLNPIPEMIYSDEMRAMEPTVIDGDIANLF